METISAGRPVSLINGRTSGDDSIYKELIVHPIQARNDCRCLRHWWEQIKPDAVSYKGGFQWVISIGPSAEIILVNLKIKAISRISRSSVLRVNSTNRVAYARGNNNIMRARYHVLPGSHVRMTVLLARKSGVYCNYTDAGGEVHYHQQSVFYRAFLKC